MRCRDKEELGKRGEEKRKTCLPHVLIFPFGWMGRDGKHEACPSAVCVFEESSSHCLLCRRLSAPSRRVVVGLVSKNCNM